MNLRAAPLLGQPAPPTPEAVAAAEALALARKALMNVQRSQANLTVLLGPEKAAEAVAEVRAKVQRAEEAHREAIGGL